MGRFLVFALPLLASCGSPSKLHPTPKVVPMVNQSIPSFPDDLDIKLITYEFYANAQALGVATDPSTLSIEFVDTYGKCSNIAGQCEWSTYDDKQVGGKIITLLKARWLVGTPQFKKTLLFHELGHCALNLDHTLDNSGSIMQPILLNDQSASLLWLDLVKELFSAPASLTLNQDDETDECGK